MTPTAEQARTPEHVRLEEARTGAVPWKAWGPYVSERQWGTVREDYSAGGDAWDYFSHDQARSRAYRWGEDGIAGICDERQRLCLSLALWNGADPILKERMFGLSNGEGNHGEDAKEYWFYLDSTPTHSYLKCQYKYPQRAFPYEDLVATNRAPRQAGPRVRAARHRHLRRRPLLRRGGRVRQGRARRHPHARHRAQPRAGRGDAAPAADAVVPQHVVVGRRRAEAVAGGRRGRRRAAARAAHAELGDWRFCATAPHSSCSATTRRTTSGCSARPTPAPIPRTRSATSSSRRRGCGRPERTGTKCAAHHVLEIPAGGSTTIRLRLTATGARRRPAIRSAPTSTPCWPRAATRPTASTRPSSRPRSTPTARWSCARRSPACCGPSSTTSTTSTAGCASTASIRGTRTRGRPVRNVPWFHMIAGDVISMPDKWEYPWFAAWDLAFHCAPLSLVDVDFAKEQVELLLRTRYMHPNGQIPAYEWNFSDVNPPVTAWAALFVYEREAEIRGAGDREFLKRVFHRLLTNFTWWVNRKDPDDRNLFQGGFLGLDNIGIFDRSAPLPGGGTLEQADGTAWMALYCQWMLQIAVELAREDPAYTDVALKFVAHFEWIAIALNPPERRHAAVGRAGRLLLRRDADAGRDDDPAQGPLARRPAPALRGDRVRAGRCSTRHPALIERVQAFVERFADSVPALAHLPGPNPEGRRLLALVDEARLRRILEVMLDEDEFLGPHGIRAISRRHLDAAVPVRLGRPALRGPLPAGGVGHRHVRRQLELARPGLVPDEPGDPPRAAPAAPLLRRPAEGRVPDGLRTRAHLLEVADELAQRLARTFTEDEHGRRPVFGGHREVPDRPALARPAALPRVLPRRQRRRHRREPPDRLDRHRRPAAAADGRQARASGQRPAVG